MPASPRPHRSLRLALPAALWLGIGAGLNVGVCWGLAIWHSPWWEMYYEWQSATAWPRAAPTTWPAPRWDAVGRAWWGTSHMVVTDLRPLGNASGTIGGTGFLKPGFQRGPAELGLQVGFPFPTLAGWNLLDGRLAGADQLLASPGFVEVPIRGGRSKYVPCLPMWPGFALNTLIYAALAWGAWRAPFAYRRRRRRRRGQCVKCAYDRTGLAPAAPCPECGTAP